MECGRPGTEFSPGIAPEVFYGDLPQIDFGETHGFSIASRFGFRVQVVNKHTHPLVSRAVRIYRTSCLPGGLYLDPLSPRFDCIVWVNPLHDQVWVAIKVLVLYEDSRVLCQACSQHIRQNARHDRRAKHFVQSLEALLGKVRVHVKEKIIYILHGHLEISEPQLVWQLGHLIEFCALHNVSLNKHRVVTLSSLGYEVLLEEIVYPRSGGNVKSTTSNAVFGSGQVNSSNLEEVHPNILCFLVLAPIFKPKISLIRSLNIS